MQSYLASGFDCRVSKEYEVMILSSRHLHHQGTPSIEADGPLLAPGHQQPNIPFDVVWHAWMLP